MIDCLCVLFVGDDVKRRVLIVSFDNTGLEENTG
jgi:hypothetical protein